ncbi:MAG: helix-turn-helix domain-containing protein [Deltaproteobacteria bacterium]|jgi:AraC-like DNA-binding protein|nr:helix-turn-helix domain-containing protein [Deltaproteobacteria bacterium]
MRQDRDASIQLNGVTIIHQKIRGNEVGHHTHNEHEFFFPLQGEIQISVQQKTLKAGAGKLIYLPPNTTHSFKSDSASQGERVILIIDHKLWQKFDGPSVEARVLAASQLCKEIVFQLLIYPKTKAGSALIQTLIQTLAEMLEAANDSSEGDIAFFLAKTSDERMKKALQYIADEFDKNLAANSISQKAGLSVRNLNRLFLKELGMTPKQVLTSHRIQEAKKLLSKGRMTVTDTAFEVGYSSVSQFISTFRKHTGQIPSAFLPTL